MGEHFGGQQALGFQNTLYVRLGHADCNTHVHLLRSFDVPIRRHQQLCSFKCPYAEEVEVLITFLNQSFLYLFAIVLDELLVCATDKRTLSIARIFIDVKLLS